MVARLREKVQKMPRLLIQVTRLKVVRFIETGNLDGRSGEIMNSIQTFRSQGRCKISNRNIR